MVSHNTKNTRHDAPADDGPSDPPTRRQRSPQEKKALDYSKQRRNAYGENPEASRKGVRRGKARNHRSMRRAVAVELLQGKDADVAPIVTRLTRRRFRKVPDTPLGDVVSAKIAAREQAQETPVTNEGARSRRRERRSGKRR